ncbi:hypothetical protein RRSWK_03432 [Rhodopirellula sp. SWK7]|nr:hypothetical protein RRSWK_03432 [Rhodopirellula sp. SWK7]
MKRFRRWGGQSIWSRGREGCQNAAHVEELFIRQETHDTQKADDTGG